MNSVHHNFPLAESAMEPHLLSDPDIECVLCNSLQVDVLRQTKPLILDMGAVIVHGI